MSDTPRPSRDAEPSLLLKKNIDILHEGITYTFKIPSIADEIKRGTKERDIRRAYDPLGLGYADGLEGLAYTLPKACALFEVLLTRCSDEWPFTSDPKTNEPRVDFTKFPDDKQDTVLEVRAAFEEAYFQFRESRRPAKRNTGDQTVPGGGTAGAL